ncbi:hypothetical protein [Micrococcus luteus]|uniref:hypothetical protein n=1 Tax=Micrococcus luteus TaxID=1270 RepID=UPI0020CC853E|nr:hypothetical protein [Micrococcus luteus]UTT46229.1 hypothetical protein NMQ02_03095 [Micrococcus luteus]
MSAPRELNLPVAAAGVELVEGVEVAETVSVTVTVGDEAAPFSPHPVRNNAQKARKRAPWREVLFMS